MDWICITCVVGWSVSLGSGHQLWIEIYNRGCMSLDFSKRKRETQVCHSHKWLGTLSSRLCFWARHFFVPLACHSCLKCSQADSKDTWSQSFLAHSNNPMWREWKQTILMWSNSFLCLLTYLSIFTSRHTLNNSVIAWFFFKLPCIALQRQKSKQSWKCLWLFLSDIPMWRITIRHTTVGTVL